jgi:hypothetical protein
LTGAIRTASVLDHEAHQSVLLNVQAMSGDPPAYGHTQVSGCASPTALAHPHFYGGGGVQFQLRTQGRQNGDMGAVAP